MVNKDIVIGFLLAIVVLMVGFTVTTNIINDEPEIDDTVNNSEIEVSDSVSSTVMNNTVTIYADSNNTIRSSQGSGFIYNDDYIITNEHVVRNQDEISIRYRSGLWSKAEIVGTDNYTDIAVLKPDKIPELNSSLVLLKDNPEIGSSVVAVGSPYNLRNSISEGIVSGNDRNVRIGTKYSIPDSIQTDVQLNPGNSGGPLVYESSNIVVGINRAVVDGIGFSVSSKVTDHIAREIIKNGEYKHSKIGIVGQNVNQLNYNRTGVRLTRLLDTRNLQDTELEVSNESKDVIITGIDDTEVKKIEDISSYLLFNTKPGDTVTIEIYVDGKKRNVDVELISRD